MIFTTVIIGIPGSNTPNLLHYLHLPGNVKEPPSLREY